MKLSMGEVAARLGASSQTPDRPVEGYSIDSRTLTPGSLFFAIRGPRFDGHEFVDRALDRGAAGAVVERAYREGASPETAARLVAVSDTVTALQDLAQSVRRTWGRAVVGITGSTGKTTTKELIAALLAPKYSVHKSLGNLNNQYGVPLTLLGLEPGHEVAVVEMAMSAPGEIARLAEIVEPETGVVTNAAPVHLEFFDSVDAIARAKRELIEHLKSPATAVLNHDDPRVRRFANGFQGRVVTFGLGEGADFRAFDLGVSNHGGIGVGMRFRVAARAWEAEFQMVLPGRHNVENALAAIATASIFEVPVDALVQALGDFKPLGQRSEVLTLPGPVMVLNDSYNSNPCALERMLETLAGWPRAKRRIVVAGEMLELGPTSPELHRQAGQKCAQAGVGWLIAVQGDARFILEGAVQAGLPTARTRFFPDAEQAGKFCRSLVEPGDVVLVKGSRGVHLEKVIETLQSLPVRLFS
ncbi:MAG TPA: UDP-N-acetylmuramoyl-tripeptide--D-alanyl-D-alanine ligase [Terriglobia bacterium]|nr:UDP-N-acetylmuramoyl-tripeptide--D-alanyl-D-alanine ligase [Terriglobia bacterium]